MAPEITRSGMNYILAGNFVVVFAVTSTRQNFGPVAAVNAAWLVSTAICER